MRACWGKLFCSMQSLWSKLPHAHCASYGYNSSESYFWKTSLIATGVRSLIEWIS